MIYYFFIKKKSLSALNLSNICMKDLTNRSRRVRTFVVLCMSCYFLVAFVNVLCKSHEAFVNVLCKSDESLVDLFVSPIMENTFTWRVENVYDHESIVEVLCVKKLNRDVKILLRHRDSCWRHVNFGWCFI